MMPKKRYLVSFWIAIKGGLNLGVFQHCEYDKIERFSIIGQTQIIFPI